MVLGDILYFPAIFNRRGNCESAVKKTGECADKSSVGLNTLQQGIVNDGSGGDPPQADGALQDAARLARPVKFEGHFTGG
jgi:hypothetical protein